PFPPGKSPYNARLRRRLVRGRGSRRHVPARRYARTKAAEKNPRLQPAWDIALQDDVLTWPERPSSKWEGEAPAQPHAAANQARQEPHPPTNRFSRRPLRRKSFSKAPGRRRSRTSDIILMLPPASQTRAAS